MLTNAQLSTDGLMHVRENARDQMRTALIRWQLMFTHRLQSSKWARLWMGENLVLLDIPKTTNVRSLYKLPACLVFCFVLSVVAVGQNMSGMPNYGAYVPTGKIDTYNALNGQITLHIPISSHAYRGFNYQFGLRYGSNIWHLNPGLDHCSLGVQSNQGCMFYPWFNDNEGWQPFSNYGGELHYSDAVFNCTSIFWPNQQSNVRAQYKIRGNYSFKDYATGRIYLFPARRYLNATPGLTCPEIGDGQANALVAPSDEGRMQLDITNDVPGGSQSAPSIYKITAQDGTVISGRNANGKYIQQITDTNGNTLTFDGTNNGLLPIPTEDPACTALPGVMGASGQWATQYFCYVDSNGTTQNVRVDWADSFNVHPSFPTTTSPDWGYQSFIQYPRYELYAVSKITLPNNLAYTFSYDPTWGVLSKITLPTGGYIRYTWAPIAQRKAMVNPFGMTYVDQAQDALVLTSRSESADGVNERTWNYSYTGTWQTGWTTTITDPLGNQEVHTFPGVNQFPSNAVETRVQYLDASNQLLKQVDKIWGGDGGPVQLGFALASPQDNEGTAIPFPFGDSPFAAIDVMADSSSNAVVKCNNISDPTNCIAASMADDADFVATAPAYNSAGVSLSSSPPASNGSMVSSGIRNTKLLSQTTTEYVGGQTLVSTMQTDYNDCSTYLNFTGNSSPGKIVGSFSDCRDNPTQIREYGYDKAASATNAAPATRYTDFSYWHQSNSSFGAATYSQYTGASTLPSGPLVYDTSGSHILDRVAEKKVYDGVNNMASSPASDAKATYDSHGNALTKSAWLKTSNTWITSSFTYDSHGNVLTSTDADSNVTTYDYTDNYTDSSKNNGTARFATKITLPVTGGVQHVTGKSYDWNTGLVKAVCGENFASVCQAGLSGTQQDYTTYSYDAMNRPSTVADGGGGLATFHYNESGGPISMNAITAIDSNKNLVRTAVLDGLGRVKQTQLNSDPQGVVYTDTTYDALGRVSTVSNSYRSTSDPSAGITQTQYDALGRITQVTKPDGSVITMSRNGNCIITKDEADKKRRTCSDALGRLTNVWEDPGGLNYETDYQYDALDNLLGVVQRGGTTDQSKWRVRAFTYDSLSRLLTANNPESGLISYFYDGNGNLTQKVMPSANQYGTAQATISYCYDALNRVTGKAYSWQNCQNGLLPSGTAAVTYTYDTYAGSPLGSSIGRLARTGGPSTGGHYFTYDAMGRVISTWQCLPSDCSNGASVSAQYNLAGALTQLTYPDSRVVAYTYNSAGLLNNAQFTQWNGAGVTPYSYWSISDGNFAANGAPTAVTLGNGVSESYRFNNRFQPVEELVSTVLSGNTVTFADHIYNYTGQNVIGNNGNMLSGVDKLNASRTQSFTYDSLNRLTSANEGRWGLGFVHDPWGNFLQQNVTAGSAFAHTHVANANNRLTDLYYDAAGNTTNDGFHAYTYDPENRIVQVDGNNGPKYTYSGDDVRVRKDVGSSFTEYVYFGSNVIAEKDQAGAWTDYIFAGGKRIAKADTHVNRILTTGSDTAAAATGGDGWSAYMFPNAGGLNGYIVQPGDKLFVWQFTATPNTVAGVGMNFSDASTADALNVVDQDGCNWVRDCASANTAHLRRFDLTPVAGKTITQAYFETISATTGWNVYYEDFVLVGADGTAHPISTGLATGSLNIVSGKNVAASSYSVNQNPVAGCCQDQATYYYHGDQIGSSRLVTGGHGWPIWQGTYLPYGEEYNPQPSANHYKFTAQERDAESGLDYFGARYYGSNLGRWLSSDWSAVPAPVPYADLTDPQSLTLYSYVRNSPVVRIDANGHGDDPDSGYTYWAEGGVSYYGSDQTPMQTYPPSRGDDDGTGMDCYACEGFGQSDPRGKAVGQHQTRSVDQPNSNVVVYNMMSGAKVILSGTLAFRNQNPGNIEAWRRIAGTWFPGSQAAGARFAIFPDEAAGFEALDYLLSTVYIDKDVYTAMQKFAPIGENDPKKYAADLTQKIGAPASTKLGDLTGDQWTKLLNAIAHYEGFYGAPGYNNTRTVIPPPKP